MPISTAQEIADKLGAKRSGNRGWVASCPGPGHKNGDKEESLSIRHNPDFPWLTCHTGCDRHTLYEILEGRFGLKLSGESKPYTRDDKGKDWITVRGITYGAALGVLQDVYEYTNENGEPWHRTLRFQPENKSKKFLQQFCCANGKWVWRGEEWDRGNLYLYRTPEVIQVAKAGGKIFLLEGEKDVNNMREKFGLCATTMPMGAGKDWKPEWTEILKGSSMVVVIGDNDETGMKHADAVSSRLTSAGIKVKSLVMTLVKAKGDFSDWLELGGTKQNFIDLINKTPEWKPPNYSPKLPLMTAPQPTHIHDGGFVDTDMANAKRLVYHFGDELRFTKERGWYCWKENFWEADDTGRAQEKAKETARRIVGEVSVAPFLLRAAIEKHAPKSQSMGSINSMLRAACTDEKVSCRLADFDHPDRALKFNCANGSLDLESGELLPHNRADMITRVSPVVFDREAKCPIWNSHLATIFDGDNDLIAYFQTLCGYLLSGRTDQQIMAYLYGTGANGKSVTVSILQFILGTYALTTPADTFMQKQNHGIRNDIARMAGARLVVASEINSGERLDESLVKTVTGDGCLSARFLNREFFEFTPQFKVIMTGNDRPRISGMDHGIRRRIHLIPFTVQITKPDYQIERKLKEESAGILNWMLAGALNYLRSGVKMSPRAQKATDDYFASMDPTKLFVDERCELPPDESFMDAFYCGAKELYATYREYCEDNGSKPVGSPRFRELMKQKGFKTETIGTQLCFRGIRTK